MKKKKLSKDEKSYVAVLEKNIPKIDSVYGLEGYCYDIGKAADIRAGRPVRCKIESCGSDVIPYRFNNPLGKDECERQSNPFGYFLCAGCGAIYPEMEPDTTGKEKNRAKGNARLKEIDQACKLFNELLERRIQKEAEDD